MKRFAAILAGVCVFAFAAQQADALVAFTIAGKVSNVTSALTSGFATNQSFTGYISYDQNAAPSVPNTNPAYYYNSFTGYININGKIYNFLPTQVEYVSNDNNVPVQDQVSFYSSSSSGPSVNGYSPGYMTINFYDSTTHTAISGTSPPTVNQLKAFPSKGFNLFFTSDYSQYVSGTITSLTALPEPATWVGMVVGFGVLGVGMRRRRQAELPFA